MNSSTKRIERVGDLIKKELAEVFLFHIKDPRLSALSITHVKMTGDLRLARVYYSFLDQTSQKKELEKGLASVKGFLRKWMAEHLGLRAVPDLEFHFDDSILYGMHMDSILKELKSKKGGCE